MQLSAVNLIALFAASASAASQEFSSAFVGIFGAKDCSGTPSKVVSTGPGFPVEVCSSVNGGAAVRTAGRGCSTFYFSDQFCQKPFFSNGGAAPDSNCYAGVQSVQIFCNTFVS